ncbi:MAG TPA: MBL fold metallo-hydrolase [Terriglobia bacterium]|nr:MBL fold metallo-hydrolase [Terriglobia bacterium]
MRTAIRTVVHAATCLAAILLIGNVGSPAFAAGQTAKEPLSKTYRVTRADDVEFQKIEPFKVFDNLYYVGPGYVSVWLLTTPQGNILFDSAQEPYVDYVIGNIRKVGVDPKSIKYIILSHGHLDHFGGAAKIQEASGARVVAVEEDWKMIDDVGSRQGRGGTPPPRVPKKDMVVKEGDTLALGGQALKFHQTPGHTPGVLTTEGITVYDRGTPYKAILWGGAGYRGGLAAAEQSVTSAGKVGQIQGVQVNLQIHSWAGDDGYPGGGVLERGAMLKSRKPGDPHPFVDPVTFTKWVKRAQDEAAKAVQDEKQKAAK